jgi:hypothetical protein
MNTKKPLTLMCVQPCIPYYAWQIEVMLNNFEKHNLHKYDIRCLFAYNKRESDWEKKVEVIKKVESKYSHIARFFYYEDTREYPISYISSIRPNVLKQHFKEFPETSNRAVFYHDCDIVFTKHPDFFDKYLDDDENWYVSDTISYIGHDYILSKGEDVLDKMCQIIGIDKSLVKEKQGESGGAQYILKNVDWLFFQKMEKDCEKLFRQITELNHAKKREDPTHHELQIWCADMWALLWNGWLRGYSTKVVDDLKFCWATDDIKRWEETYIFHNAGVTESTKNDLFYKAQYRNGNFPFNMDIDQYKKDRCSYNYILEIKSIGEKSCLL